VSDAREAHRSIFRKPLKRLLRVGRNADSRLRPGENKRGIMYKQSLRVITLTLTLVSCALFTTVNAQPAQDSYTRTDAMIPMRDGAKLNTHIYVPTRTDEKFPILLLRTPYGIGNATPAQIAASLPELTAEG